MSKKTVVIKDHKISLPVWSGLVSPAASKHLTSLNHDRIWRRRTQNHHCLLLWGCEGVRYEVWGMRYEVRGGVCVLTECCLPGCPPLTADWGAARLGGGCRQWGVEGWLVAASSPGQSWAPQSSHSSIPRPGESVLSREREERERQVDSRPRLAPSLALSRITCSRGSTETSTHRSTTTTLQTTQ